MEEFFDRPLPYLGYMPIIQNELDIIESKIIFQRHCHDNAIAFCLSRLHNYGLLEVQYFIMEILLTLTLQAESYRGGRPLTHNMSLLLYCSRVEHTSSLCTANSIPCMSLRMVPWEQQVGILLAWSISCVFWIIVGAL